MNQVEMTLDTVDRKIVSMLVSDGRLTHEEIAKQVGLSRPAVHDRIRKLENSGVLRGYHAEVDWTAFGLPLTAFVWIQTQGRCGAVAEQIWELSTDTDRIESCHRVVGEWCLLVHVRSTSIRSLEHFIDGIAALPEVVSKHTTIALTEVPQPIGVR